MSVVFNAAKITNESVAIFEKIIEQLEKRGLTELVSKLKDGIEKAQSNEKIKVAFVGQFSSGKSSIISALTGNKAIKIGSDVTTDVSENYEWGNFLLTDTPGLQNNETHDEIAEEAIKHSDLIVYCITSELFNKNTLADFKNLAFVKGYKSKMVLLVNKINSEFTNDIDTLLHTYEMQLEKDLMPYHLDEVAYYFIDVKDYLDGIDECDDELVEESRFNGFVDFLNKFLAENGLICKLTTPILFAKQIIEEAFVDISETTDEKAKRIALSRLSRTIDRHRAKASKDWDFIISDEIFAFLHQGFDLANRLGEEEIDLELQISEIYSNTNNRLIEKLQAFVSECESCLREDLDEIFQSQVGQYLLVGPDNTVSAIADSSDKKGDKISSDAAGKILGKTRDLAGDLAASLKPEQLYKVVEKIGHKVLKIKFKPWGITKVAEKLGKCIKALGPVLEVVGLAMDIKETYDESKEAKQLLEARKALRDEVKRIGDEIRACFNEQKTEFLSEMYEPVLAEIQRINNHMTEISNDATGFNKNLNETKSSLDSLFEIIVG